MKRRHENKYKTFGTKHHSLCMKCIATVYKPVMSSSDALRSDYRCPNNTEHLSILKTHIKLVPLDSKSAHGDDGYGREQRGIPTIRVMLVGGLHRGSSSVPQVATGAHAE